MSAAVEVQTVVQLQQFRVKAHPCFCWDWDIDRDLSGDLLHSGCQIKISTSPKESEFKALKLSVSKVGFGRKCSWSMLASMIGGMTLWANCSSGSCPCPRQGVGARCFLKVLSNPNQAVTLWPFLPWHGLFISPVSVPHMPLQTNNNLCFHVGTQINKGISSGPQRGWAVIEVISFAIFQSTEQAGKKPSLPRASSISTAPATAVFDTSCLLPAPAASAVSSPDCQSPAHQGAFS